MNADTPLIILMVEDEALVRMHGADILEDAGFGVIEAANADEALVLLQQHGEICLLFSDIDMPGSMDGLALARIVHQKWPHIPLLLTSGRRSIPEAEMPDDVKFVSKPWDGSLIAKIRAALKR